MGRHFADDMGAVPPVLYKFRTWAVPTHRQILKDLAIWFASPALFNDPFDCTIPLRYDLMSRDDLLQRLHLLARKHEPDGGPQRWHQLVAEALTSNPVLSQKVSLAQEADIRQAVIRAKNYGVFSLAGVRDNILLWSHYADCHRGFCVELDGIALSRSFERLFQTDGHAIISARVQYQHQLPTLIPSADLQDNEWIDEFVTKSSAWEYEREFRFIYVGRSNLARHIDADVIRSVTLGCQISSPHKAEIKEAMRYKCPNAELFQAMKSREAFALTFEREEL